MKSRFFLTVLSVASLAFAQNVRGPQPAPPRPGAGLDMAKIQTLEGKVSTVNIAYGSQYPSIQINQTTIKVAPVWYLLENDFEIQVGDNLKVTAAPALSATDPYLVAIAIANNDENTSITLRDSFGVPLWMQPGRAMGQGQGVGQGRSQGNRQGTGTCACALTSIATVTGTVEQVTMGVGIQMPTLVLSSAGKLLTIKIGPERILLAADVEITAGATLTVKYGVTCTGELVALELTNATTTLVLRSEDGSAAWR